MELRHFRYFVAVAEEGHITRAAEKLGIQQPPLSQQIKSLEEEIGVPLFIRTPKGVQLTEPGRAFLEEAQAVLAQADRARARVMRAARGEEGELTVGFTSSVPFHPFFPGVIRSFKERYPGVSLRLEEKGSEALTRTLHWDEIDVAFIRSDIEDRAGLAIYDLPGEPMVAALPDNHRLAARSDCTPVKVKDLADSAFILYRRHVGAGFYDAILAACHRNGFAPQIVQEAPRILSALSLVGTGAGITLVPKSFTRLRLDGVVYRQLDPAPELTARLSLAVRQNDRSPAVQNLVSLARAAAPGKKS